MPAEALLPLAQRSQKDPSPEALSLLSSKIAALYSVLPLFLENEVLHLAAREDFDLDKQDALEHLLHRPIQVHPIDHPSLMRKLRFYYPETFEVEKPNCAGSQIEKSFGPVSEYFEKMMGEALRVRASDIHLEPFGHTTKIRYRIDGKLYAMPPLPEPYRVILLPYIKVKASMPIDRSSLPLDGRLSYSFLENSYDLRLATLPTVHGESLVIRILEKSSQVTGLLDLGLSAKDHALLLSLIQQKEGLLLATGPTGAGKTTTLYAILQHLVALRKKVFSIEDPIEYQIPGVNAIPLNKNSGMTYAAALKSILRQTPDVIFVGEIRDASTASACMNAALTGHLVVSTLHAMDAIASLSRLYDLGMSPFLLSTCLRGIIAQRLVRKVCPECSRKEVLVCPSCQARGFKGRIPLFEVLTVGPELQAAIYKEAKESELRVLALSHGFSSLHFDAQDKVAQGLTTFEEVQGVLPGLF